MLLLTTLFTVAAVVAAACSGNNNTLPRPQDGTGGGAGPDGGTGTGEPCAEGQEVECHITVGEHEGVLTCLNGIRRCEGGSFGACSGKTSMRRAPITRGSTGAGNDRYPRPRANSEASDGGLCATNPCDPSCQSFEETPDGGAITLEGSGTTYTWSVGDINELPEAIARQGTHQPCMTSEDCQFDQHCENPLGGACAHDVCANGVSLLSTCSPCATKVCEIDPTCCTQTIVPSDCGHDACQAISGEATNMNTTCGDPCIEAICAFDPLCCTPICGGPDDEDPNATCAALVGPDSTCTLSGRCRKEGYACPTNTYNMSNDFCTGTWNAHCVALVGTLCPGKTCGGPPPVWDAACVALAETVCGANCQTESTCTHDKCYTGERLHASCDPCVEDICETAPSCCSGEWTQTCVDLVETVCGQKCPQRGLCKSYLPNETNPDCAGVDLTLGVPCGGTIPVCNRGNTQAPAGIPIYRYPAGAGQLPSSAPGRVLNSCNPTGGTLACTTAMPINPGECINVAGCTGVVDGMELIVNPNGDPGSVAECQCANNGSVYQSAACQSPGCIATASVSLVRPVTLFVALDISTSMVETFSGSDVSNERWIPATNALKDFFKDPESAGLGVALRFWPDDNPGPCNDNPACPPEGGGGCALARIPFDGSAARRLTADPAPMDQQELALVTVFDSITPYGDTPMYPALDGATTWAINYKTAHPEEEVAVVFVTDGYPTECNTVPNDIANLAANAFQNHGVRVHMVGFGNSSTELNNLIAARGGGRAFNLSAGTTLQANFRNALTSIRGEAMPCDVAVPVSGVTDPGSVSVVHVNSAGTETTLTRRAGAGECGDGWYFADATNTSVKLCPQTCNDIREQAGGKVRAIVPCVETGLSPITTSWERYEAICPPGTKAQWGYLRYRTLTPGDSSVEFNVRVADDPADLATATVRLVATAQATPTDTQVCDETSTPPCAVDLFTALGELPDARRDYLELQMRLNPTSSGGGGVQIQDWEITYSCPDSE